MVKVCLRCRVPILNRTKKAAYCKSCSRKRHRIKIRKWHRQHKEEMKNYRKEYYEENKIKAK